MNRREFLKAAGGVAAAVAAGGLIDPFEEAAEQARLICQKQESAWDVQFLSLSVDDYVGSVVFYQRQMLRAFDLPASLALGQTDITRLERWQTAACPSASV